MLASAVRGTGAAAGTICGDEEAGVSGTATADAVVAAGGGVDDAAVLALAVAA